MKSKIRVLQIVAVVAALVLVVSAMATEADASEQQNLVDKARMTMEGFTVHPDLEWFRDHVREAKGLLIVPQMLKGAFFVGGSGGRGVLVVRDEKTGKWSQPVFYTLGGASLGIQFGGQAAELVLMVMSRKGIEALYSSSFKLGGDVNVAVGPKGAGVEGSTAPNLAADYLSFALTKGAFAGFSVEGAVIKTNDDWNQAYYGKAVRPVDVIVTRSVKNPNSAELRMAVAKAASASKKPVPQGK